MTGFIAGARRLWVIFAIIASLGAMPVAAASHGLQHLRDGSGALDKKLGHAKAVCEVCAAFAGAAHGLPGFSAFLQFASHAPLGFSLKTAEFVAAPRLSYRQRAPPVPL